MPTVIHELADAFLRRKQALAERGQAKTKLAGSDYFMPKSAKEDLNNRLSVFEQGGLPELLKQGASEMYRNPIVNTAISLTPGAGDVQSGYEAVQSAKEGNWGEAGLNALGVLPFIPSMGMIGKTVWHGSPHTFDKFDMSKIGTGEGAQAYGHGLYFAESPDVAANYAPRNAKYEADLMKRYDKAVNAGQYDKAAIYESAMLHESPAQMKDRFSKSGGYDEAQVAKYHAIIDKELAPLYSSHNQGMYKVDLPDEQIAKMLDWDKPLTKDTPQEVKDAMNSIIQKYPDLKEPFFKAFQEQKPGYHYYSLLNDYAKTGDLAKNQEFASNALKESGIPGLHYLDQASRGAGEGTRNYVVFSDEIPKILERNGTSVFKFPKEEIINVPISQIEHGESAMPGGKLTWPGSKDLIKQYAEMPTDIPAIRAIPPDADNPFWMIEDGSHRYEAAKLRGMKEIPVIVEK